jgi:hypothetical protein
MSCRHVFMGMSGLYCGVWREEVWDDSEAQNCEAYDG